MTKVLVITEHYWPEGGGGILATHLISKILVKNGFEVTVVTGTDKPSRIDGVEYLTTPHLEPRNKVKLWLNIALLKRTSPFKEMLGNADIVYIPRYCYPVIPVAKRLGKKVIVHLHDYQPIAYNAAILHPHPNCQGSNSLHSVRENVWYELMEHRSPLRALAATLLLQSIALTRRWLEEADKIICVSNRQREIVASAAPELAGRLKVIYNPPPDVPTAEKALGRPTFLYLGGDSYVKGFYVFLDATRQILKHHPNVKFLLTKSFRDSNKLLLRMLNRKFRKAYNLLGYLKHEDVLKLHGKSYALLFPSIWEEPLPYAILESMLAGTIPITSRVGGVPEIVEGTIAEKVMFTPGNVDEFIDCIELVLSMSKEQLVNIGYKLRETVLRKFDNERIKQELLKAFTTW